jgi:hypothetical protein
MTTSPSSRTSIPDRSGSSSCVRTMAPSPFVMASSLTGASTMPNSRSSRCAVSSALATSAALPPAARCRPHGRNGLRIVEDVDAVADVVGITVAEFIPRQVMHLQQLLTGFPLIRALTST